MTTATPGLWRLVDHVCRECLGRLAERMDGKDKGTFECTNCGTTHAGDIKGMCGCGLTVSKTERDMGFRCVVNPKRGPAFPAVIVLKRLPPSKREATQTAVPLRFYKPARVPGEY